MTCPLLAPTALPFTVRQDDSRVLITLARDACHHHGLAELGAITWVRGISVPLAIDLAQVQLLGSALIGWMFGLLHEGKLRRLALHRASHRVQTQIEQVGLGAFVDFQPFADCPATRLQGTSPLSKAAQNGFAGIS